MEKKRLSKKTIILCIIGFLVILGLVVVNTYIILPLADYETSELVAVYNSPNGNQSAKLHYLTNYSYIASGDTYENSEVSNTYTLLSMYGKGNGKTIYYRSGFVDPSKIHWIDNNTLDVDGVKLNPSYFVYDYRIHFWKKS